MNITPSQMLVKVGYGTIHFSTVLKGVDRIHMVKIMHFVCTSVLEYKCRVGPDLCCHFVDMLYS